jgi:uncharacterized protein VirK/YbjX
MLLMFPGDKRVYSICFSCTEDGRAWIGGIQGGKDIDNEEVKALTKELYGIRPKNLIITLLYGFCRISISRRSMRSTAITMLKATE